MISAMGLEPGTVDETCETGRGAARDRRRAGIERGRRRSACSGACAPPTGRRVVDSAEWLRGRRHLAPTGCAAVAGRLAVRGDGRARAADPPRDRQVTPDAADAEIAQRLDVPRGALLLTLFQVDETADGRPVLVSREHHLADAFEMTVYRRGPSSEGPR